jgi:very-short-patch-repair endonuclease
MVKSMTVKLEHPTFIKSPKLIQRSRDLRKAQTPEEAKLWAVLRNRGLGGYKFKRQTTIGRFIVDFSCSDTKLIIEVDGGQHIEQEEYDRQRTAFLESQGYRVLRFWNNDVMKNIEGVVITIQEALLNQF